MTWFKVDDGFPQHPKVLGIPREGGRRLAAVGLWNLAGAWCARNLTDGRVPAYMPEELGGTRGEVDDLLRAGLWEEDGSDFVIHDYLDYNLSKDQVLRERQAAADRQRRARERASEKRAAGQPDAQPFGDASRRDSHRESQGTSPSRRTGARGGRKAKPEPESDGNPELPLGAEDQPLSGESRRDIGVSHTDRHGPPDPTRPVTTPPPTEVGAADADAPDSGQPASPEEVNAGHLMAEWINGCRQRPPGRVIGQLSREVRGLLDEDYTADDVRAGIVDWQSKNLSPSCLPSIVNAIVNARPSPSTSGRRSPTEGYDAAVELARSIDEAERAGDLAQAITCGREAS